MSKYTTDLIDTLWNVKHYHMIAFGLEIDDLIDTLWNVKEIKGTTKTSVSYGFNRYIVECKGVERGHSSVSRI